MRKGRFAGKYYKFISQSGFSFAIIIAYSNEGKSIQLITKDCSYEIKDCDSIVVKEEKVFEFHIRQKNLNLQGTITIDKLNPLKGNVMGPFEHIPFMECKHSIYSMYHGLSGWINIGDKKISFQNGYGYIEGDAGKNFPKKYIWYNSVLPGKTVTIAIAHIPFAFFSFTGVLCFVKTEQEELSMCTWNGVKIRKAADGIVELTKRKYKIHVELDKLSGHALKAPVQGDMKRIIKENLVVPSKYTISYDGIIVLETTDPYSSCEWVDEG